MMKPGLLQQALQRLNEQSSLWLAIVPVAIYALGYFRTWFFLTSVGVVILPTEIYPVTSLFVSGLFLLFEGLLFPGVLLLLALGCSRLISALASGKITLRVAWLRGKSTKASRSSSQGQNDGGRMEAEMAPMFSAMVCMITLLSLRYIQNLDWLGLKVPSVSFLIRRWLMTAVDTGTGLVWQAGWLQAGMAVLTILLTLWITGSLTYYGILAVLSRKVHTRYPMWVLIWLVFFVVSDYSSVAIVSLREDTTFWQLPGIRGTLLTDHQISQNSVAETQPSGVIYKTRGLLLSQRDSTYFFLPSRFELVSDHLEATIVKPLEVDVPLILLPSEQVRGFWVQPISKQGAPISINLGQ